MNPISFPLNRESHGPQLTDLHDTLAALLERNLFPVDAETQAVFLNGLREERAANRYDDITQKLISMFQEIQHLPFSGDVDQPTAQALTDLLRQFGLLDQPDSNWNKVAEALAMQNQALTAINQGTDHLASIDQQIGTLGKAIPLAQTMRGEAVRSLHAQLGQLGVSLPASEQNEALYGQATRTAVLQLQARYQLAQTGVVDTATRNALEMAIGTASHPRRVEGRILLENGLPAARIQLQIVHRGFGDQATSLGDLVETDDQGFYALPYDASGAANLEVQAVDPNGTAIPLSHTNFNADRNTTLNLVAPASIQAQTSELHLLRRDLTPLVGEDLSALAQAREDANRQDLTLIHQNTGWDARLVALASQATATSSVTGIATDALYGALRAGLPSDPDALALVTPEAFDAALAHASTAGVVALDPDQKATALSSFENFRLERRSQMVTPGTLSSVATLVDTARIAVDQKATFQRLAVLHQDTAEPGQLWQAARENGISDEAITELQLQGKLAYLTLNNAPLIERLMQELDGQQSLDVLVDKDFYRADVWVALLNTLASPNGELDKLTLASLIPALYRQEDILARRDAYADDLAQKLRQSFPTRVIVRRIAQDELQLGEQHDALKQPTQQFLQNAAAGGFQLGRVGVDQYVASQDASLFAGIPEEQRSLALHGTKLLARAYQMTPNDNAMTTLLSLGFSSAHQVTMLSKAAFTERYWQKFGSRSLANMVWEKSSQISSVTFGLYAMAKQVDSTPPIMALSGSPERHKQARDTLHDQLKQYPTMQSLFGALDFCECEHCHSVLSPAAYLVDLLQFLDPPEQHWKLTLEDWKFKRNGQPYDGPPNQYLKPYDALMQRRPDLAHLPLTCENTNTAMPYIDLVNEILEYYLANNQLDEHAVQDTGAATTDELLAEPQNLIPAAYDQLRSAHYPLSLPFDLWLETVRRFCSYYETPFWQVLEVFRPDTSLFPNTGYGHAAVFREALNLSPGEYAIYTNPDFSEWFKLYGYTDEPTALAELKSARTMANRLGVSYKDLATLLKTEYINPRLATLVMLRTLKLEINTVFRYKQHPAYPALSTEEQNDIEQLLAQATTRYQPRIPGFDAKQWLEDTWAANGFDQILLLHDSGTGSDFAATTLMTSQGSDLTALDAVRLNLLVRLARRLGWSFAETDRALMTFLPAGLTNDLATLGAAFKTALVYCAHLQELETLLTIGKHSRQKLLTLWSDLPTRGNQSLYAQVFLTRSILKDDAVFDDPFGNYLSTPDIALSDHLPAVQAALTLTADEIAQILRDGASGDQASVATASLALPTLSLLYRYAMLARGLKLSISELIMLKTLTGLNPFHPLEAGELTEIILDHPLQQTLAFVRHAQRIKAGPLTISDLAYLFRHQFDQAGTYRASNTAPVWLHGLAETLHQLANDYQLPSDPDSISDDRLKQQLALVFTPEIVEQFMGFWLNKTEYSVTQSGVVPEQRIPARYRLPDLTPAYDEVRQRQQLSHIGVVTPARKTALLAQVPPPPAQDLPATAAHQHFVSLLDALEQQSNQQFKQFFERSFDGLVGFNDFYGNDATSPAQRRMNLLTRLLPFLHHKLQRQTIVQTLTTQTGAEASLIEALLTNPAMLAFPATPTQPLLATFAALATSGLTLETSPNPDLSDLAAAQTVPTVGLAASTGANSARWRGFLVVPQDATYRLYARLGKQAATVHVQFEDIRTPVLAFTAAQDNDEQSGMVELKANQLYGFTIEATNLQNAAMHLLVKGETSPKGPFSQLELIPWNNLHASIHAVTRLTKALLLTQALGLSVRELQHLLSHPADVGDLSWQQLPAQPDDSNAVSLFNGYAALLNYLDLKLAWSAGSDDLVAILEQARSGTPPDIATLCTNLASLTRRTGQEVQEVASELGYSQPTDLAVLTNLVRLWKALQIQARFGVRMVNLHSWLTPTPDASVAMDIRHTIKARYEPDAWQRVARAIFDPLRQQQRDALVAAIMHKNPELDSLEKLFEFFLLDPGMQPVVLTSRIRLAISSLQTFIQRCFLNLEKRVHPAVLHADHWAWMKRYRIWEANRKIFLFPENWLEPEWRDDKTHLYQELESSLLQGDVTNQLAEDALYVYLQKLNQLARLEIVSMYAEEQPPGPPVMHVIGRTYTEPARYFYRRYANAMWTPWEPVTAEIEGNHVVVVVWRERLHLFWVSFMEKIESAGAPSSGEHGNLADLPVSSLVTAAGSTAQNAVTRTLDMQLNWSEYYQGEWSTRATSGFGYSFTLNQPFNPAAIFLSVEKEPLLESGLEGALRINLHGLADMYQSAPVGQKSLGLELILIGMPRTNRSATTALRVTSKNSRPEASSATTLAQSPYRLSSRYYSRYRGSGPLNVTFVQTITTSDGNTVVQPPAPQTILGQGNSFSLLPTSNRMALPNAEFAPLISPVFYTDETNLNTFFVEPSLTETTIDKWEGYYVWQPSQRPRWDEYVEKLPDLRVAIPPRYLDTLPDVHTRPPIAELINPSARYTLKTNPDLLTSPAIAVRFGETLIGPQGRIERAE